MPKMRLSGLIVLAWFSTMFTLAQAFSGPSDPSISVGSPHVGTYYCPETGIVFNVTSRFATSQLAGANYAYYTWSFPGATSSTFQTYDPNGTVSLATPGIIWPGEGTFTVSLTSQLIDGATDIELENVYDEFVITIDFTCCGANQIGPFNTDVNVSGGRMITSSSSLSGTYDGFYYVRDDIEISNSVTINGVWSVDGDVTTTTPGGTVDGEIITVDGVTLTLNGELRADCDNMWGGVNIINSGAFRTGEEACRIEDSWNGIHSTGTGSGPFEFDIKYTTFFNNRYGLQAIGTNGGGGHVLIGCTFDSDPTTMLEPYIYNSGHNTFRGFRMISGVTITGDSEINADYFNANTFRNAIVGLDFSPASGGSASRDFSSHSLIFDNNTLAGFYVNAANDVVLTEFTTVEVPITVNSYEQTQWNSVKSSYSSLPSNKIHGIAIEGTTGSTFDIFNADFTTVGTDITFSTPTYERYAIYLDKVQLTEMRNCEISSFHRGVSFENEELANFQSNLFYENKTGIYVDKQSTGNVALTMNCNKFRITSAVSSVSNMYGLFVTNATDMDDIGGDGTIIDPAGNGWPADPISSPGYSHNPPCSTTTGGTLTLSNWIPWTNFTAIHDDNGGTPGWKYYAFDNEYTGTFSPSSILDRNSGLNASSCSVTDICFPATRVAGMNTTFTKDDFTIHPNPASHSISASINADTEGASAYMISMEGRRVILTNTSETSILTYNVKDIEQGMYILIIELKDGTSLHSKLLIER